MDNSSKNKKGAIPNQFIYFLIAAILAILIMQNLMNVELANVSFSYELEHLVNLDLIQQEENRKTAINDNLVSFSGKFREKQTSDGKSRYKYLTLLKENHELLQEKEELLTEGASQKERIGEAAQLFLEFSGLELPINGYVVASDRSFSPAIANDVVVTSISDRKGSSLKEIKAEFRRLRQFPNVQEMSWLGRELEQLVGLFRSPLLGIGNEQMKAQLRVVEKELLAIQQKEGFTDEKLKVYEGVIEALSLIVNNLNEETSNYRLTQIRSVRDYRQSLEKLKVVLGQLDENQIQLDKAHNSVSKMVWFFNNQEVSTRVLEQQDPEQFSHWYVNANDEWEQFAQNHGKYFTAPDQALNTVLEKTFRSEEPAPQYASYLFPALIIFSVMALLYLFFARQVKGVGANAMSFGKSTAKLVMPTGENRVTFRDVAGIDEALEELEEIVEFLKTPHKFTVLGGRIPKGVLCVGPPGCGKTLIAKAVSGEANCPFFSISGSDFVEMFVGVGASRIRDLFEQAKKNAPCIIFIDEIDAVGRHRGAGIGGGHDEREQTLNQLLVEMDGFDTKEGVILMAATNRPDVLDKALLRPGRFDRHVVINLPDINGRFEILKVHARKIKMDQKVELMDLARSTPGSSGADLMNILNEAALLAARKDRTAVTSPDISEARDKVLYGKERRSMKLDEQEKKSTAYHEAGHTIVGLSVEHGEPIEKVTIIPRGLSLGATMFLPEKDRVSYWKKELYDKLAVLMGGRAAEEIFLGDLSSGARQDIEQATQLARNMVCQYGMSSLGPVAYHEQSDSGQYLGMGGQGKNYSDDTAKLIDAEVLKLLEEGYNRAVQFVEEHRDKVELITELLIEYETLEKQDILEVWEKGTFSRKDKDVRRKKEEEKHKKAHATPPPPPVEVSGEA